jgi:hypothetical protein
MAEVQGQRQAAERELAQCQPPKATLTPAQVRQMVDAVEDKV